MDKKTILFPTDFSERADYALQQTIKFGEKVNFKLIIYHAYHRPVVGSNSPSALKSLLIRARKTIVKNFDKLLLKYPELRKIEYEFRMELGLSVDNIIHITRNENIDFIIMATEGARGFGELWGTKTARIIKSIDLPVLVLPDKTSLNNISKIGLACDYSEETNYKSLTLLGAIAESLNVELEVITLNRNEKSLTQSERRNKEGVLHLLEGVPASLNFTSHTNVEEGIIDYCNSNGIGMIAILPKNYNFIEELFHESLIEKMAFHSPIPLLVLK